MSARRRRRLPASIVLPPRWRRHGALLLTLLVAASAIVCERSGLGPRFTEPRVAQPDSADRGDLDRYHDRSFRVVHVVDGDTLDIDAADQGKPKTRIRLWGVDTPEVAHGKTKDMHYGPEARTFAEKTLDGREVHIVLSPKRTRDRYGRLLAYVFLERGGEMFNEMLIEQGMAYADPRFDHAYKKRFIETETRTRREKVGLWSEVKIDEMPEWRRKREAKATEAAGP